MSLVGLVVGLIVIALLWWAVQKLLVAFHIGEPISTVVLVAFVVLVVLWLVSVVSGLGPVVRLW